MTEPPPELIVLADPAAVAEEGARRARAALREALQRAELASIFLAGGQTAVDFHQALAAGSGGDGLDWKRVHAFFGDERAVPPGDPQSNFRAAREHLIEPLGLAPTQVHRMLGEAEPEAAARAYEAELRRWLEEHGRFDLVLLGIGEDGHTASLFPGSPALAETQRLCLATRSPEPPHERISLTLPALARARALLLLATGAAKSEAIRRSLEPSPAEASSPTPAARARPAEGRALWLVDREAASELRST